MRDVVVNSESVFLLYLRSYDAAFIVFKRRRCVEQYNCLKQNTQAKIEVGNRPIINLEHKTQANLIAAIALQHS